MWSLLAGYAGLVSVGQRAFIGLGAYFVLIAAQHGMSPFSALPVAAVGCAVVALPVSWLVFRLRGGYFAIATWVVAEVFELVISRFSSLGGGTGKSLPGLSLSASLLTAYTYWAALALAVLTLGGIYLLLRGRLGLALTAVRDNEIGARSAGVRVARAQRIVYLVAALGCGAAGALLIISQLNVEPLSAFTVQWSAEMIFVTIIGGIGTIEGPIVGTIVFFVLQQTLSQYGAWYLIILGSLAVVIAIWVPRGLWGLVADRLNIRLFPVGYWRLPERAAPGGATASRPPLEPVTTATASRTREEHRHDESRDATQPEGTDGISRRAPLPRRSRGKPAPTAGAAAGPRRRRRRSHLAPAAAAGGGRCHPRGRAHAGGRRAPVGHRRRAPSHLVAHGLHLPARRREPGRRKPGGQVPQRVRRLRVHLAGVEGARPGAARRTHLRRRLQVPAGDGPVGDAQADHPVSEHGPLPRRAGGHRRHRLSRPRRVLGRPERRLRRRGGGP